MKTSLRLACLSILLLTPLTAGHRPPPARPALREAAEGKFLIGAALMSRSRDDPALAELVAEHFNTLTSENELKPASVQPEKGRFDFTAGEKLAEFAETHDMKLIGHTLLWHQQSPAWMFEGADGDPLPREEALANLKTHIHTVVKHFKGRVHGWDVVNEALADGDQYLRDTPTLRAIGEDYIIKAFQFAREADPDVELYYNDYNIEQPHKRAKALRLVRELREAGIEPDAIGIQGHWRIDGPDLVTIEEGIQAFRDAGLKIMITELDVDLLPRRGGAGADVTATEDANLDPYADGLPDEVQQKLADRYRELFSLFARHADAVTRVTFWGIDDGHSWLNNWPTRGRTNHPLLFDRNLQPKPAFDAVIEVLTHESPGQ